MYELRKRCLILKLKHANESLGSKLHRRYVKFEPFCFGVCSNEALDRPSAQNTNEEESHTGH